MKKPTKQGQRLNDANMMQYVEQIVTKMAANADLFTTPVPALATVETALQAFRHSATEAAYRDSRAIGLRKEKRRELEYLIGELSKYVDTIAKGHVPTVLASGFAPTKDANSYEGFVPKALRLVAEPKGVGSARIRLKVAPWAGARMYQFEYRKKGVETDWVSQLSTKSFCILEGLDRFQEYEFRASYIGIDPRPNYSDIVSSYVV